MQMRGWRTGLVSVVVALCASRVGQAAPQPPPGLNAYVHRAMALWKVPGLALAIVQNGKVVVARGYGLRELGRPGRVDADTLFTIGSDTKAFTAAALGLLVTEGKLHWNGPIIDYVPGFRLSSPYVTEQATLRDLLSHRTGYCDPFGMWYMADDTRENILQRLRYQKPRYGFREHFCYNNTMYLVAAQAIYGVTGTRWGRFVSEHLLAPLGMARTVTNDSALKGVANVAAPHGKVHGRVRVIRRYWSHNMDAFAPVGAINSSARDMSHWLVMLLAKGRYRGRSIVPAPVVRAMETPQSLIQSDSDVGQLAHGLVPGVHFLSYGLGFLLQEYGGHRLIWHPGNIDGMSSVVALVPNSKLGVVVLSNMNDNWAPEGVMFFVVQSYLGLEHHDASRAMYAMTLKAQKAEHAAAEKLAATRIPGAKPALALGAYVGRYSDKFYGTARVSEAHGHLVLTMGNPMFTGDLQPWHGETFRVRWRYRFYGDAYVTFTVDAYGRPNELRFARFPSHYERVRSAARQAG